MKNEQPKSIAWEKTAEHDRSNQEKIRAALKSGRIDDETAGYLSALYSDGMYWFREVFYVLGKCFGAPKARVMQYNYETDSVLDKPIKIIDINPMSPYLVQHRLDADPMRNQFFTSGAGHKIDLSVSSIVTVIVGAQKNVERAVDKITGKYYQNYLNEVTETVYRIISKYRNEASARAVTEKIKVAFAKKFITSAPEVVLEIIGKGHEKLAVDLIRELDKIQRPHLRLQDVWRVKCLFDLIPQARTFVERIQAMMPDKILSIRDSFYDIKNPRNYRDVKLKINLGKDGQIIPLEIVCQVRIFFGFESKTHGRYEIARKTKFGRNDNTPALANSAEHEEGVREYNLMICRCLEDLFERVGWNILYSKGEGEFMFDGFPKRCTLYYPQKILEVIFNKLDTAVKNEVFRVPNSPLKLTEAQECEIFHFMARFVLVSAMPYLRSGWKIPGNTVAVRLFNFVMQEIQRYYK